jgi:hypothetical protein
MRRCLVAILLAFLLSALAPPPGICATGRTLSGLTENPTPAVDDLVLTQDVSDPSMDATGTSKKTELRDLFRTGVSTLMNSAWVVGGTTLTAADLGKTFFISATSDFQLWLPGIDVSVSGYFLNLIKEGKGGISVYLTDATEFIGNCASGASIWVPASSVTKVASIELQVGPSGVTYIPRSTWPTSGTDRWYFSE